MNDATLFHNNSETLVNKKHINCHCDCREKRKTNYKSNLQITVQRNFANMMISELTEGTELTEDNKETELNSEKEFVSSHIICHQLGSELSKRSILESLKYDQNASYTENVILSMLKQTKVILTKTLCYGI